MTRKEKIYKAAFEYGRIDESAEPVDFIEGAMWADAHPHWISVEDGLPQKESEYDDNSIVVLATDGNDVYKALYRSNEYLSGWFTHDMWELDNITHWMPLPEPPEHLAGVSKMIGSSEKPNNCKKKGGEQC